MYLDLDTNNEKRLKGEQEIWKKKGKKESCILMERACVLDFNEEERFMEEVIKKRCEITFGGEKE